MEAEYISIFFSDCLLLPELNLLLIFILLMVNQSELMKHCAPFVLSLMKTLFKVLNMQNSDGSLKQEEIIDQMDSDLSDHT